MKTLVRKSSLVLCLLFVLPLLLPIGLSYGQTVDEESGDAGDVPSSAQDASGISITSIAGHIPPASYWDKFNRDVDMYKITINEPASFSATTFDNGTSFNTYLFLFDSEGKAVYMNDDIPRPGYITPYLQSRLPAGHALGPTTAGDYYLAVTGYICLPYDEDNNLVFETGSRLAVLGPSLSNKPVVHWQSPVYATFHSGNYQIDLTGVGPPNSPPVADAGPDQTVEATSPAGASITLDGSDSYDPDGDLLTYEWTWDSETAVGVNPTVVLPLGLTTILLTVSDGQLSDTDTVDITVVDTTGPQVEIIVPQPDTTVQDTVTFLTEVIDVSEVVDVYFYVREPDGGSGTPIGYEELPAILTTTPTQWEYQFDTTVLLDGYYVILSKAIDSYGNEGWTEVVPFSIRNWTVSELLPASESNKAGRTMPVKFSLRIEEAVDPAMPFVHNEQLEIKIYDASDPDTILQTSVYGDTSRDYRINDVEELYITNFKTNKQPAVYMVEILRLSENFLIGSFTFETVK